MNAVIGLLVVCVCLLTVAVVALAIAVVRHEKHMSRAADEIADTMRSIKSDLTPLAYDTRRLVQNADSTIADIKKQVGRIGDLLATIEKVADESKVITDVAGKAMNSSKATIVSVIEGIREGVRVLRGMSKESREDKDNERAS